MNLVRKTHIYKLSAPHMRSWQNNIINTTVIHNRNYYEIYHPGVSVTLKCSMKVNVKSVCSNCSDKSVS